MSKITKEQLEKDLGREFWSISNAETFRNYYEWLTDVYQISHEHVIELFSDLYTAVSREFGD